MVPWPNAGDWPTDSGIVLAYNKIYDLHLLYIISCSNLLALAALHLETSCWPLRLRALVSCIALCNELSPRSSPKRTRVDGHYVRILSS